MAKQTTLDQSIVPAEVVPANVKITKEVATRDYNYCMKRKYDNETKREIEIRNVLKKGEVYTKIEGLPKYGTVLVTKNHKVSLFNNGKFEADQIAVDGDEMTVFQEKSTVTTVPSGDIDGGSIITTDSILVSGIVATVDLGGEVTDTCFHGS